MNELAQQIVAVQEAFARAALAAVEPMAAALVPVARMFSDPQFARAIAECALVGPYDPACQGDALRVLAAGTEWERPLSDGVRAGDSLPWLVYADWLEEHDEPHRATVARRVAEFYRRTHPTSRAASAALTSGTDR